MLWGQDVVTSTHLVIRSVDEDFINDLEEAGNEFHFSINHSLSVRIESPHGLGDTFDTPNV